MKIKFIINPISGKGNHNNVVDLIDKYIDKGIFSVDSVFTEYPMHAMKLAKSAVKDGVDIVVAVGGDGTMRECAMGVLGSSTALAILPCGSGNGFALHFKMSSELPQAIAQLNHCSFKQVDSCTANGNPFFNVSGIGFDAHIASLFARQTIRGFSSYIKLVLRECIFYSAQDYIIEYDGKIEHHNALIISWANATQFGNNAIISPESKINDGLVDICILSDFSRWKVPLLLYRLFNRSIHHSKYMTVLRSKSIKIKCKNGISHLDGESVDLGKDITIDTHKNSLKLFVPNG
ncbi:MAG: diacylglycerol/lipid kinase family protein [Flavobacteriales bacterium]